MLSRNQGSLELNFEDHKKNLIFGSKSKICGPPGAGDPELDQAWKYNAVLR